MSIYATAWHNRYNLNSRLKTKFRRKLKVLQQKTPNITPFSLKTKVLASTMWGKAWNANLKNYTFNNVRLEKGKLNFRCEALADFKIRSNQIKAIVLGSKIQPYNVTVTFDPIKKTNWTRIQKACEGHFECFDKILDNQFPRSMSELFTMKPTGLFPTPKEIDFECSCSARANICKHTAVVLFAFGAKFDENPQLLFNLRGVSILDLISKSIHEERKSILKRMKTKNPKILSSSKLSDIFNIDI